MAQPLPTLHVEFVRQVVHHIHGLLPLVAVPGSLGLQHLLPLVLELDCNSPHNRGPGDGAGAVGHQPHLELRKMCKSSNKIIYSSDALML